MITRLIYILLASSVITGLLIAIPEIVQRYISNDETVTIEVKTVVCGNCVETIERALSNDPGIIKADVSLETKSVSVRYDKTVTNKENIENQIVNIGYDANDKIADSNAYKQLSSCCQIRGDGEDYMKQRQTEQEGCKGGCCSN